MQHNIPHILTPAASGSVSGFGRNVRKTVQNWSIFKNSFWPQFSSNRLEIWRAGTWIIPLQHKSRVFLSKIPFGRSSPQSALPVRVLDPDEIAHSGRIKLHTADNSWTLYPINLKLYTHMRMLIFYTFWGQKCVRRSEAPDIGSYSWKTDKKFKHFCSDLKFHRMASIIFFWR